jgi:hypothetical protein
LLLTLWSALIVAIVFLVTEPPAIESLSSIELSVVGLVTVIAVFGQVIPDLIVLIFPPQAKDSAPERGSKAKPS